MKLDKYLIIFALETLLEQVKDAKDYNQVDRIKEEITKIKNYEEI